MNAQAHKKAKSLADEPAKDWHPADIKAALTKAGWTLSALAEEHKLTGSGTLSKAMTQSYPIAEKRIADALGLEPKDIWPSRYFDNGQPKPRGFRAMKFNRLNAAVNGKDQAVNCHETA